MLCRTGNCYCEQAIPRKDAVSGPRAYHLPGIPVASRGEKRCHAKSVAWKNVLSGEYKSKNLYWNRNVREPTR